MSYYFGVLKKYAVFSGRAQRAEYRYFILFNLIISIILNVIGTTTGIGNIHINPVSTINILGLIYGLVLFLPSLGVTVRRLHDTNKSGWWILISLIPLIGFIWLIILMTLDSFPLENKYGVNLNLKNIAPTSIQQ